MASVKRRKIGGNVPGATRRKASSDLESANSNSPDSDVSNETSKVQAQKDVESPKTFKDLVCNFEYLNFDILSDGLVGNH
jgi:hypothetical protein